MDLRGKYGTATVFTDTVESTAISQIIELMNQPFADGANVRIMPDVHAGKGCVIGTTMKILDKVCPNLVGVDVGCGVLTVKTDLTGMSNTDVAAFDRKVHRSVPSGFSVHDVIRHPAWQSATLSSMKCWSYIGNRERIMHSLGTLGGGNHFIELNQDKEGRIYLVIHTGSRNLGLQVAGYYQDMAIRKEKEKGKGYIEKTIEYLKAEGRQAEIHGLLRGVKVTPSVPEHLAYLAGSDKDDYIHDMQIAQRWAEENREAIASILLDDISAVNSFHTVHNYIDNRGILRKGAVSAHKGKALTIPMNMRDGSLICIGKGNDDWNQSAPHGAGRLMSRGQAKRSLSLEEFSTTMSGVYSTTVNAGTLDEAPMAYKPMQDIIDMIGDTVDIVERIVPIYNFKSSGE